MTGTPPDQEKVGHDDKGQNYVKAKIVQALICWASSFAEAGYSKLKILSDLHEWKR